MIAQILSLCIATTMLTPAAGDVVNKQYIEIEIEEEIVIPYELQLEAEELGKLLPLEEIVVEEIIEEETIEEKLEEVEVEVDYKVALKDLGYYRDDHSDKDINMRDAVLRFQSEHNLKVDGIFGEQSLKALKKRLQDEKFVHTDVITNPPTEEQWITINKTKRILTLYKGNEVIKKYPIAQGKDPWRTPEGKFTIVVKWIDPAWGGAGRAAPVAGGAPNNPLGPRWLGLSHGGGGQYGIHGNAAPRSIGTDVSLGCIRMINSDVRELYSLVQLKTPVWIGTHEGLKKEGVDNKSYIE